MLAITIFEDTTQIVVGKKIKNKLEIKSLISYKSIYEASVVGKQLDEIDSALKVGSLFVCVDDGVVDIEQAVLERFFQPVFLMIDKIQNTCADDS